MREHSDNKQIADARDRAWVALNEPYEVRGAALGWLRHSHCLANSANIDSISMFVRVFPHQMRRQGRVPRSELYDWLNDIDPLHHL